MCSFCGKSHAEVRKLIAGPGVYICDSCINVCKSILDKELNEDARRSLDDPGSEAVISGARLINTSGQDIAKKTLSVPSIIISSVAANANPVETSAAFSRSSPTRNGKSKFFLRATRIEDPRPKTLAKISSAVLHRGCHDADLKQVMWGRWENIFSVAQKCDYESTC